MLNLLKNRLSPFQHIAFRRFFFVQSLSLIGTWSHDLARAWIVIELMGKAGALGSLLLASAIPSLFLILHGGILVDRIDSRRMMIFTKSILGLLALSLAFMTEFAQIQLWHLLVFAFIEGVTNSFDSPAYQTLAVRLVPREELQQAIAINSTNFHTARMLGPVIAGVLMAWYGPSLVFLFDGLSYLGLILVLKKLDLRQVQRKVLTNQTDWSNFKDGLKYLFSDPRMRFMLAQLFVTISLAFPVLIVVFRTYVKLKFNLSGDQFGYVFAFPALGAMLGSISFAAFKPKVPLDALKLGVSGAVVMLFLLPQSHILHIVVALMALTGFFMYLSFASLTVSLHLHVEEEFRGRMGSLIGMAFISIGPLMSFPIGVFADHFGYEFTIYLTASLFGVLSLILAWRYKLACIKQSKHMNE